MAEFPALPLWTDAYLADTMDLSAEEHGVYLLLLMAAWRSPDCALPDDDARLARMARLGTKRWQKMRLVMERFFLVDARGWTQKRLLEERDRVSKSRAQKKQAADAKWRKNNDTGDAAASAEAGSESDAEAMQNGCNPYPYPYNSVSNETDAKASQPENLNSPPSKAVDPFKSCFDAGRNLLGAYGIGKSKQGQLIAKWKRELANNPEALMAVLLEAQSRERADIVSYVQGSVNSRANGRKPSSPNLYSGPARNGIDEVLGNG